VADDRLEDRDCVAGIEGKVITGASTRNSGSLAPNSSLTTSSSTGTTVPCNLQPSRWSRVQTSWSSSCRPTWNTRCRSTTSHMPELQFTDENNATGVWALFDWLDRSDGDAPSPATAYPTLLPGLRPHSRAVTSRATMVSGAWPSPSPRLRLDPVAPSGMTIRADSAMGAAPHDHGGQKCGRQLPQADRLSWR